MADQGASHKKITALNDYCLENVMVHLSLDSLTNMAVSNPRFGETAAFVYRRKHAAQVIRFDSSSGTVAEGRHFLNILDAFGVHIRRLCVNFNSVWARDWDARDREIFAMINEKCSKSVEELSLSFVRRDMIFTNPFVHLSRLMIADSFFSESMVQNLAQNSRNLENIELHNVENVFNATFASLRFPSLVHFAKFNEIVKDPEREMENLQHFRRFVNGNGQITSFGVGSIELSYMLKYKLMRQQFFNEMHPDVPCPDKRDLISYLFPFEPIYQQNLNHIHINLNENVNFLRVLRHRLTTIRHLPIEHLVVHTNGLPLHVVDLLIQFRELRSIQYFVRNEMHPQMIGDFVKTSLMFPNLLDVDFTVLNENQISTLDPNFMQAVGVLLRRRDELRRVTIGYELPQTLDAADAEYRIRRYQAELRQHYTMHIPTHWQIDFQTRTIDVQRQGTKHLSIFCFVLTKKPIPDLYLE